MKTVMLIVLSALCMAAAGCARIYGPVEQAKTYIDAKEDMMREISKKLETSPTPAGADEARKIFDSHKDDLAAKIKAVNDAPQGINGDWLTMIPRAKEQQDKLFIQMVAKFTSACMGTECLPAYDKVRDLQSDFVKLQ
jgi:hypothetical protein